MNEYICIVDDDDDVRDILSYALEFHGIRTLCFNSPSNAEEALASMMPEELPRFIIVDYLMPQMNGLMFISRLKEKYPDTIAKIPFALSTAQLFDESEDLGEDVILLEKPWNLDLLLSTVKQHLTKLDAPSSSPTF